MAQTGFTPIQLYRTTTASATPSAGNLADGELAINTNDGRLFYKDNGGVVQTIAWKTTPVSAGGTGVTSSTGTGSVVLSAAPTLSGNVSISGTDALKLPAGTTAERPSPTTGQIRFNTTLSGFEGYNGSDWGTVITTGSTAAVTQGMLASGVAGNGPAFSAYRSSDQTGVSDAVNTKVQLNLENFDTASCFDSTTNYRFTPNVAGYYQINGTLYITGTLANSLASIYKNGSLYCYGSFLVASSSGAVSSVSSLVYLNGTTDYVELYGYGDTTSGTPTFSSAGGVTSTIQFSGFLARAA